MSLFVGNLSKNVTYDHLRDVFDPYGPCKVQRKNGFAFIKYDNEAHAEKALKHEKGKSMGGLEINIEWSKSSKNFDPNDSNRPPPRKRKEAGRDVECYNCRRKGHYARECTRRRSRSPRGRDRRRDDRSRSRSDSRRRGRDRDGYKRGRDRRRSRSDDRDSRSDYKRRGDRRGDKYMDRRRKRRDSRDRDDPSRSNSRYNKKNDRGEDYNRDRPRSGSRGGDRHDQDRPYSQDRGGGPVNDDRDHHHQQDYSKNEPDIIQKNDGGEYDPNEMENDGHHGGHHSQHGQHHQQEQEVQIGVDPDPKEIAAMPDQMEPQKDSFAENDPGHQGGDHHHHQLAAGGEGEQINHNEGNPEVSGDFNNNSNSKQEDAPQIEGDKQHQDEMKEQAE